MTTLVLPEKARSSSFGSEESSNGLSGLISPRFMLSTPPKSKFNKRHFRQSGDGLSLDMVPSDDADDLVIDIADLSDSHNDAASSGAGKKRSQSFRSKSHRQRKNSVERDRSSTVATESECQLRCPQESPTSTSPSTGSCTNSADHVEFIPPSVPRLPRIPQPPEEDEEEQPSTSRKARQRTLQRSARMSPSEIRSIMNTVDSPRSERRNAHTDFIPPRSDPHSKSPVSGAPKSITPLLASRVIGGSSTLLTLPSPFEEMVSPLCYPPADQHASTPTSIAEVVAHQEAEGSHSGSKNSFREKPEKTRHGHARFFSMSTLKAKPNSLPDSQKVATNPSSPLVGNKIPSSGSSPPDPRVFNMTLEEVVKEPDLCLMFMKYLEHMNASEGLEFLVKLEALRVHEETDVNPTELIKEALAICEEFIREGSDKELNLSRSTREAIEEKLVSSDATSITKPSLLFQEARIEVFNMLGTNMYSQWLSSLH